jgi:outer membrane protein assembly factor BamB
MNCLSGSTALDSISVHRKTDYPSDFIRMIIFSIGLITCFTACHDKNKKGTTGTDARMLWGSALPGEIYYSSPVLSTDAMSVYTGTSTWLTGVHGGPNYFIALNAATGSESWRFPLGTNEVRSTPAVAADGSIYFTAEVRDPVSHAAIGDKLFHLSAAGDSLWTYDINPSAVTIDVGQSSPAIGPDGTVYVAGDRLYAITSAGTLRWTALGPAFEALRNAPAIGPDGTVYFVYHNISLTALRPADGSVIWSTQLGVNDHCFASPAIGADGTIYVCTQPGLVYAVSSSGQILWTFSLASAGFSGTLRSSPAVGNDGSIYFGINYGSPSSAFFAVNPNGSLKWIFEPADLPPDVPGDHFDIYSSPALGTDSAVYFGQELGRVYALNSVDGSLKWLEQTKSGITWSSPAIDRSGSLFISDISGRVYSFRTDSRGLDTTAAWPKFRYNNQNTGYKDR